MMKAQSLIADMFGYIGTTLYEDSLYLFISIAVAVCMAVYIDPERLRKWFLKKPVYLIPGSVGVGTLTPLCACGTMAVVLSLLTTALPWGAIMAFLVSSPLMSPDTFILLAGVMGVKFAIGLTAASIFLGLSAGWVTHLIEKQTTFLTGQLRINKKDEMIPPKIASIEENSCCKPLNGLYVYHDQLPEKEQIAKGDFCCISIWSPKKAGNIEKLKLKKLLYTFYDLGLKKVLPLFTLFIALAWLLKTFVPEQFIMQLFSGNHWYSVPLATLIGLPLYISDATVVPLLQVLTNAGASQGALLAFMISGPATSLGVIGGLSLIMKKKAILLYLLIIFIGAVLLGFGYDIFLKLFIHS